MSKFQELANAVRFLSMDAVEKAKSGHPGAPMGMAEMATVLWNDFLKHNPSNPKWWDRDRFVLSNGHASMLLYSVLHLSGYDLSMDDIKAFRQIHSKTPGHPEYGLTPGVEMTSGPLGQGIAGAVGMALAERLLAAEFNMEDYPVVDHYTYVFMGDGCMMEGLSHEACSLAGTLGLGKLIALWDDNGISIDGKVENWFADNTPKRFEAYGWHVISKVDGHDMNALKKAIAKARKIKDKPTLICCQTVIAKGAPTKAGSSASHGSPLGEEEISTARRNLNWKSAPFEIPDNVKESWDARKKGKAAEKRWDALFAKYAEKFPDLAAELKRRMSGELPEGLDKLIDSFIKIQQDAGAGTASRISSKQTLDEIAPSTPELIGGSADLTGSVGTRWNNCPGILPHELSGRYIFYGVREFAMGAMMNGMALHGGFIPYAGTFLVFSDYAKNAIRMASLMQQRVIWILTHDSIMVGEDGPTHQPVEQMAGLRLIPGIHLWRPADSVETAAAWKFALMRKDGPTCLALSRQNLSVIPRNSQTVANIGKGAYIIKDCKGQPDVILLASGSEVSLTLEAAAALEKKDIKARVVSMPCAEVFDAQDREWRESVLPHNVRARVAVEAASSDWWRKYVGLDGSVVGMTTFGESAPGKVVYDYFGFTVDNILKAVRQTMQDAKD